MDLPTINVSLYLLLGSKAPAVLSIFGADLRLGSLPYCSGLDRSHNSPESRSSHLTLVVWYSPPSAGGPKVTPVKAQQEAEGMLKAVATGEFNMRTGCRGAGGTEPGLEWHRGGKGWREQGWREQGAGGELETRQLSAL